MGLDKISVTLYDLLGYLLPGYVLLFTCSIAEASSQVGDLVALSRISHNLVLSAIVSYFLGQISHAIGSWIKLKRNSPLKSTTYQLGPEITARISQVVMETYGLDLKDDQKLSKNEIYLLADSYIVAAGGLVERDILTAREGFFKASMVSFAALGVTLLGASLMITPQLQIRPGVFISFTRLSSILMSVCLFLLVLLFRQRFIFFNCIKRNNSLLTFLALRQKVTKLKGDE